MVKSLALEGRGCIVVAHPASMHDDTSGDTSCK